MKPTLTFFILVLCLSCTTKKRVFEEIPCTPSTISENDNLRQIFRPCRQYIYRAQFWDSDYNLVSNDRVWMMATGQDWDAQPEQQDVVAIQYGYDEEDEYRISSFSTNKSITQSWQDKVNEWVIENGNRTFMHPFRSNQYLFTEVAPFPEVIFPLEAGKTWQSNLNIHEGWGDWANSTIESYYEVMSKDSVEFSFGNLVGWHISATAYASFGNSQHDFWYNDQYGFVKMVIKNYEGQILKFELEEIIEP